MADRNFTPCPAIAGSLLQDLQARRTAALATMRTSGSDFEAFASASKEEAELAAQIRRLKRDEKCGNSALSSSSSRRVPS